MARSDPSPADAAVLAALAGHGLYASAARLERWRAAGLLPPYPRRWLGRGRGSIAEATREHVEIAAMLTRHTAQGRDLRWSVLSWFRGAAMEHATDGEPAPQPPMEAVKEALAWALPQLAAVRFLSMAAQAHTEEQADAFYIYAENQRHQWGRPHLLDPEGLRGHILAGQDAPSDAANRGTGTALIHLSAAAGLGGQGIGADLLAEALAGSGLLPQVSREMWEEVLTQAELEGRPLVPENLIVDPLEWALLASPSLSALGKTSRFVGLA